MQHSMLLRIVLADPRFEPRNSNALAHAIYNIESMRLLVGRVRPLLSARDQYRVLTDNSLQVGRPTYDVLG